ncbi:hypothetical protein [Neobacillus citreus]|uniref:Uncharacterized protein n=1 Tax=Neobacillus citreus TaxID=2833578 RepID=A0A942T6K4_9BACI|nr:hypothetical protein [Neobacillus citreus]MCH6269351.1 hypothetical protein [Neobacillus citreus]
MNPSEPLIETHELFRLYLNRNLYVDIEIFKVPEGYKCFTTNNFRGYDDLEGYGVHKVRDESFRLAMGDLAKLMRDRKAKNR